MRESVDRLAVQREWRAHWPVPIAAAVAVMTSLTHFATLGVFLPAIEAETGWSRSGLSFGMLLFSIETIVAAPFVGMLVDRFGPRRIGIPGLALYLAAVALLGRTGPSIWTWWAAWMLLGIGGSLAMFNVWTTAISRHFDSARGMAMGIALAGTSMAAIVMPLLATAALHYADWRTGYAVIALVQALITFPLVLRWFTDGDAPQAPAPSTSGGASAAVLKSRLFAGFALLCLVTFLPLSALNIHFVPILRNGGLSAESAAGLAALFGVASLIGQVASGWMLDRFPAQRVFATFLLLGVLAIGILLTRPSIVGGTVAAVAMGLLCGAGPACIAYLCSRDFELRFFGTVLATLGGVMSLSAGLGSAVAGAMFDRAGSYVPFVIGTLPMLVCAILLTLTLGRPAPTRSSPPAAS